MNAKQDCLSSYRYKSVKANESHCWNVAPRHKLNPRDRRDYGDLNHLIAEDREFLPTDDVLERDIVGPISNFGGWDGSIGPITCQVMTDGEREECYQVRVKELARLKAAAAESGNADDIRQLRVFREKWCKGTDEPAKPKYWAIVCHRRLSQWLAVGSRIVKLNDENIDAFDTFLPLQIPDTPDGRFFHDDHRRIFALRENEKLEGFKPVTPIDRLKQVYHMVVNGNRNQSWLEKNMGLIGTARVVYYYWARFIQYCEDENKFGLRLWERLDPHNKFLKTESGDLVKDGDNRPVVNPDWLDFDKFNQRLWQGPSNADHKYKDVPMGQMCDISLDLKDVNAKRKDKPQVYRPGVEYVTEWINDAMTGGNKAVQQKIMKAGDIETLSRSCPDRRLRAMAKAIFENDTNAVISMAEKALLSNWTYLMTPAVREKVEDVVKRLEKADLGDDGLLLFWDKITQVVDTQIEEVKASLEVGQSN